MWKLARPCGEILRGLCPIGRSETSLAALAVGSSHQRKPDEKRTLQSGDPDVFGNLEETTVGAIYKQKPASDHIKESEKYSDDEGDRPPHRALASSGRRRSAIWYGKQIEKLGKEGKVAEALKVFEIDMLKTDRVMPTSYVFTTLMGVLGRAGYTKKAFQLFNKMKAMKLEVEAPTYTALFNACSNSPWLDKDGLKRAHDLRQLLKATDVALSQPTYHAMLKALARGGDLRTAFEVVDEMSAAKLRLDAQTFSFLMMACIADQTAGFKLIVEVWHMMAKLGIKPDVYHFNLLLTATKTCGVGNLENFLNLVQPSQPRSLAAPNSFVKSAPTSLAASVTPIVPGQLDGGRAAEGACIGNELVDAHGAGAKASVNVARQPLVSSCAIDIHRPATKSTNHISPAGIAFFETTDLLSPKAAARHGAAVESDLSVPEDRLALLGGFRGVLRRMEALGAAPNCKTFTILLELLPPGGGSLERDLLMLMEMYKVEVDMIFCNTLIRLRNKVGNYRGALEVLGLVGSRNLVADVHTFACLAMGCKNRKDGLELLRTMKETNVIPNIVVFNVLMRRSKHDFMYKIDLCKEIETLRIVPDQRFLDVVSHDITSAKNDIVLKEKELKTKVETDDDKRLGESYAKFMLYYKTWRKRMGISTLPHPWENFRKVAHDDDMQAKASDRNASEFD